MAIPSSVLSPNKLGAAAHVGAALAVAKVADSAVNEVDAVEEVNRCQGEKWGEGGG